jgi:hypothetical protein
MITEALDINKIHQQEIVNHCLRNYSMINGVNVIVLKLVYHKTYKFKQKI